MLTRGEDTTLRRDGHAFWRGGLDLEAEAGVGRRVENPKCMNRRSIFVHNLEYIVTFTDLNLLVRGALSNGPSKTTTSLGWVTNFGGILLEALFGVPMTMEISHCPSIVPVGFPF